jgi:3-phosphoshikimate 1-carboxyvinyltransferase
MSTRLRPLKGPVEAFVTIPGSKSYTNRALIMAAMTNGTVTLEKPLESDDTVAMMNCLTRLGIPNLRKADVFEITGGLGQVANGQCDLDCNISGTTIRFLTALAAVAPGTQTLYGKEGLNRRPIGELVDGLRGLGADITYGEREGFPPIKISSGRLNSGVTSMNGDVSSQYFSAMLMAAPAVGDVTIEVVGEQISKPYIDMTIDTMREFGVNVTNDSYKKYSVAAIQKYTRTHYTVESDASSASYFAAIAALTKSRITLANVNPASKQPDMDFLMILKKMGAEVIPEKNGLTVVGRGVTPLTVDMEGCPDQAQTLAVLAAFAKGTTTITGVRSLRVKETERVVAVENELRKMGIETLSTHDTLTIHGGNPKPTRIDTYGDHRMAMSFAVGGTLLDGMEIQDPSVVEKTFPRFWETLSSIGVGVT